MGSAPNPVHLGVPQPKRDLGLLAEVGLSGTPGRLAWGSCRGQQQRVAIARRWWRIRRLILADEPARVLDSENADTVMGK